MVDQHMAVLCFDMRRDRNRSDKMVSGEHLYPLHGGRLPDNAQREVVVQMPDDFYVRMHELNQQRRLVKRLEMCMNHVDFFLADDPVQEPNAVPQCLALIKINRRAVLDQLFAPAKGLATLRKGVYDLIASLLHILIKRANRWDKIAWIESFVVAGH